MFFIFFLVLFYFQTFLWTSFHSSFLLINGIFQFFHSLVWTFSVHISCFVLFHPKFCPGIWLCLWHALSANKQISGRDKTTLNGSTAVTPTSNSSQRPRPYAVPINNSENFQHPARLSTSDRYSDYAANYSKGSVIVLLIC